MARNRSRAARRIEARTKANTESRLAMQTRFASEEPAPPPQVVRVRQSPLERLYQRGSLSEPDDQDIGLKRYEAGRQFASDFERARIIGPAPAKAAAWETRSRSSGLELTEWQVVQYQRYRQAVQALGADLSSVVEAVCCHEQSVEDWATFYRMRRQDATAWLRLGLSRLVDHYGFFGRSGRRSVPIREQVLTN